MRVITNSSPINQLKATGRYVFEGVDSNGEFNSVIVGQGSITKTSVERVNVIDHTIDRFFLIKNPKIGQKSKKKILIFMNF